MAHCICIMMQKDEILLEPWLVYHGYLFGFENLYVYDNGSSNFMVCETLARFAGLGVNVRWEYSSKQDFCDKGEIIGKLIRRLQAETGADFYFPLDCDEFVTISGEGGFSCRRSEINAYLDQMVGSGAILHVSHSLINIPGKLDIFAIIDFSKSIIPNKSLSYLDHGFHNAELSDGTPDIVSRLLYIHLHNKPFSMLIHSARQKLSPFVDCDDLDALRSYKSNGYHLVRYFFDYKNSYGKEYEDKARVLCPDLERLFISLRLMDFKRLWSHEVSEAKDIDIGPNCVIEGLYNRTNYLLANKDVANSNMDPLLHYAMFGYDEGRPLSVPKDTDQ